ncbi:hypothetical protein STRTUCAR8_04990 [Streptomyces turgidiscabies Car8]|uniref:Uncharacterized protein n=1 Tax=Streptomyces turgidiscabies (strain Car8) TaxID=698760 RepID=L7EZ70_STRT8|nr:hypothetical protein STRTUCAR8_04990 [Streptomyces turgidiscabies Car8]
MRGRKPRHSSSLTLGLSSRCGRDCRYRKLIKTVRVNGIDCPMLFSK